MARDAWIQRFDERADEDDRYARHLEQERADRAAEKADLAERLDALTCRRCDGLPLGEASSGADLCMCPPLDAMEHTIESGLRPPPPPPPGPLEPPVIPDRRYGPCGPRESKAFIALGWVIAGIIALVLAAAVALTIFLGVAWALGGS